MSSPQIGQLLSSVLKSPKGFGAVLAIIGSVVAFVYMFLLKSSDKPSKRSSNSNSTNKSTPAKSPRKTSAKQSPHKDSKHSDAKTKSATAKTQKSTEKKPAANKLTSSTAATASSAKTKASAVSRQVQARKASTAAEKDDGEWITVNKKKPKTSMAKKNDESASAPQATRSSTRRATGQKSGPSTARVSTARIQ